MENQEELLRRSLQQYRDLTEGIKALSGSVTGMNTAKLEKTRSWFEQAMEAIRQTDAEINVLLRSEKGLPGTGLFQERLAAMQTTKKTIDALTPTIGATLAVHKSEMKNIRIGRQLTGGYASKKDRTGRLISSRH